MSLARFLFHSPEVMALLRKRQKALRDVRKVLENDTKAGYIGSGSDMAVSRHGGNVVKEPRIFQEDAKRRAFLDHELSSRGYAPETFLVETRNKKYVVQPEGELTPKSLGRYPEEPLEELGVSMGDDISRLGFDAAPGYGMDLRKGNLAQYPGGWKIIDSGQLTFPKPQDRAGALQKFISYGRRKKPWLED